MAKEKLTRKEIESAIEEKKNFLVSEMTKLWKESTPITEEIAVQVYNASEKILELFKQKEGIEIKEAEEKFAEIEKVVLEKYLSAKERIRITALRDSLKRQAGNRYETSYQQAIMKLYNKEVIIKKDSVQFLYANKELDKQELQYFPKTIHIKDGIENHSYKGVYGESVYKRVIEQRLLDPKHPNHHIFQKAKKNIEQEGKYLATYDNTFTPILNGFTGTPAQKIRGMQLLTWFFGWILLSETKESNDRPRTMVCERRHLMAYISNENQPGYYGCFLIAKDC